jgi:hypothetical protein
MFPETGLKQAGFDAGWRRKPTREVIGIRKQNQKTTITLRAVPLADFQHLPGITSSTGWIIIERGWGTACS